MFKLVVVGLVATLSLAEKLHPIRQQVVDDIKSLTNKWTPMSVEENPLANLSYD